MNLVLEPPHWRPKKYHSEPDRTRSNLMEPQRRTRYNPIEPGKSHSRTTSWKLQKRTLPNLIQPDPTRSNPMEPKWRLRKPGKTLSNPISLILEPHHGNWTTTLPNPIEPDGTRWKPQCRPRKPVKTRSNLMEPDGASMKNLMKPKNPEKRKAKAKTR